MMNNDYIKGYFDAQGYIYSNKRQSGAIRWRIVFQDQDRSQIGEVHTFLTNEGDHAGIYPRKDNGRFGSRTVQKIIIERYTEIRRFLHKRNRHRKSGVAGTI